MKVEVIQADYHDVEHQRLIPELLDRYARDPMGGGAPLKDEVRERLVGQLAARPFAFTLLAFVDGEAAGLANCFEGFSTFACRPLVNIHDLSVSEKHRGLGVSQQLLQKVEDVARSRGCCKITLEVLGNNIVAQAAYRKFGFTGLVPESGAAGYLFWEKKLS